MQIILLTDLENVGFKHEVVEVKNGYGRNYLIPQGLAVIANGKNREKLAKLIADEEAKEAARKEEFVSLKESLDGKTLKVGVKASETGQIFGSVNEHQVAAALEDQYGKTIERKKIKLPTNMNEVGTYPFTINLLKDEVVTEMEIELVVE